MDKLLVAEAAEEEYADSLRWYAERSTRAAERFEVEFEKALEAIAAHPECNR
jgi:plasmid stabilization system protein ParE